MNLMDMDTTKTGFSDSNDILSNSSSICCLGRQTSSAEPFSLLSLRNRSDISALNRLSNNLESIFGSNEFDFFADAKLVVSSGREVPVHRCVLSARSPFFRKAFSSASSRDAEARFQLKDLAKDYDVGFEAVVAVLRYLYSGKVGSFPEGVCVCVDEDCTHTACRPTVDFLVEVLYASFTFQVFQLVALYQRQLLEILDKISSDDMLVVLYVAKICGKACEKLLERCIEIVVKSDVDAVAFDKALPQDMVKRIMESRLVLGCNNSESHTFPDKHVKRIHRALESDDVELVRMLLKEADTNLDDAYALHYAVAYCDAKTTTELLDLGLADVNCRNPRGYTVLHVAALRREPKIIVSLLTKGARPSDLTLDGRKALQITKRLTKAAEYFKPTEEGKTSHSDRLCIEILEQAERRDPLVGEASLSLAVAGDDLRMKLLYLENRVGLAKLLFPIEAKVVMDIAQIGGTSEFPLFGINSKSLNGNQRTTVDLNEAPFKIQEEHLIRLRALSRTVELGKRFFPRCSEVLNKIMDTDDLSQLACLGNDTPEERFVKRRRYMELQEVLNKAFNEDREEFDRSGISSSSSSTSIGVVKPNGSPPSTSKRTNI